MPRCFETFCESGFSGKGLQLLVDEIHPGFVCEHEQCSLNSPGAVVDNEEVAFLLINPLHYDDERKTVVPDAFQELVNRDLSVLRAAHASTQEADQTRYDLITRGADRIPPQLRLVDEVCIGLVGELRRPLPTKRLLAVYDTGLDDKPAHASIFTTREVMEVRKVRKLARERIHAVMTGRRTSFGAFRAALK